MGAEPWSLVSVSVSLWGMVTPLHWCLLNPCPFPSDHQSTHSASSSSCTQGPPGPPPLPNTFHGLLESLRAWQSPYYPGGPGRPSLPLDTLIKQGSQWTVGAQSPLLWYFPNWLGWVLLVPQLHFDRCLCCELWMHMKGRVTSNKEMQ